MMELIGVKMCVCDAARSQIDKSKQR
jgi:hypothetical protein